jgi:hypothetical protein
MSEKKMKIEFAPGCFDQFEGTQEELDQLIQEITASIESGEFQDNSQPLDFDELMEEDPELAELLMKQLSNIDDSKDRKLN